MSGLHEVDCNGCGERHVTSAEQARAQRVLRCACGQFVRLDRALAELRSDPAPPPTAPLNDADEEDDADEETHMLSSLAAVAALRGRARSRAPQVSLADDDRVSRPVPRGNTLRSLSPAPLKQPSSPPGADKPIWYVDLGGSETVEMTIEQLIIARRSGKLGEGALVWREGMPQWRPVGTLIPTGSRPTPPPPAPSWPPAPRPPSRPASPTAPARSPTPEATPQSLASYERPLATLEFALEKSDVSGPRQAAHSVPPSSPSARVSRPPAAPTPLPRPVTWRSPVPAPVAQAEPVAVPRLSPLPAPAPLPVPAASKPALTPTAFHADRPTQPAGEGLSRPWLSDRPRWVSACVALLVCTTASGSGALLVRSLKLHRQPPLTTGSALPRVSARNALSNPAPAAEDRPQVVELESLSVEHRARPAAARPASAPTLKAPAAPPVATSDESADSSAGDTPPEPATKAKNSNLPAAARANPYTTGSVEAAAPKKAPATGSDEPGF